MSNKYLLQWNCRGLKANLADLDILIQNFTPAVISLQETLQSDQNLINLRNYAHYYKNNIKSDGRPGGGVSIFIKKCIPHSEVTLTTSLQATAAIVSLHRPITICSVYLPPSNNIDANELNTLLQQLPSPVLLLGDFNAHSPLWGCRSLDSRGKSCEEFINNHNLCLLNSKLPTYHHPATGSRTSIDLSICDPTLMLDLSWNVHDDLCGSDHFPIIVENNKPAVYPSVSKWKLTKADWTTFQVLCEQHLNVNSVTDINAFTDELVVIAGKVIPKTNTQPARIKKPWFDETCITAIKNRKSSLKLFTNHPTAENLDKFKMARAKARRTIREAKKQSWQTYVSGLNCSTTIKKAWDMVRKISGKGTPAPVKQLLVNNTLITNIQDITNTLAKNFAYNSSTSHYTPQFQKFKKTQEQHNLNFKSKNSEDYNMLFSMTELCEAIRHSHDTAPGPDNVHYQFLKHLPKTSLQLLLSLFNNIWTSGEFPQIWQQGIVIPIPKPNKEYSDPNSYRPIALTSCLCKTMERMVNSRLVHYLDSNDIISNLQSGFRKQRSTIDQLVRLESWVREGLSNREHVVAVFFDLEKAYDTTWRYGILLDLFNAGLRGFLPIFISNFLKDRFFQVRIGSTLSDQFSQDTGVPQGSILSVTLFNIKINSIVNCVGPGTESSLYVDDFLACARSQQMRSIERQLQLCLNNLQKWSNENGFRFSNTKTVCIHFCNKRSLHPDPILLLDKQPIPVVPETKFLGVIFDRKLSFIPHLQYLRTKCTKAMNLLKVVSHRDWGGDSKTLLKLYRTLIRSKLDYGSIVYGSARKSYLQMLDPIQTSALRLCLGAFRTSPVESLQVEANEPPLALRRIKLTAQYVLKVKSCPANPTHKCIFDKDYLNLFKIRQNTIPPLGIRILPVITDMKLNLDIIAESIFPRNGVWTMTLPEVFFNLHLDNKAAVTPDLLKAEFYIFLSDNLDSFHIYTDGSKDENAVAAAAVSNTVSLSCRLPNEATVFISEAQAILLALEIIETSDHTKFLIFSDSMSCLQALKNHKLTNPYILQILEKCHTLLTSGKSVQFHWLPSHVGITGNENADKLAKMALKLPVPAESKIPYTDLKHTINMYVRTSWQQKWNLSAFNKLKPIKPLLAETKLFNITKRRDEVTLYRLRIGHTYLSHSYLLKRENGPDCTHCNCNLTVQHILIECPAFSVVRRKHFQVNSLHDLFNIVNPSSIINFLHEIKLYNSI